MITVIEIQKSIEKSIESHKFRNIYDLITRKHCNRTHKIRYGNFFFSSSLGQSLLVITAHFVSFHTNSISRILKTVKYLFITTIITVDVATNR